MRHRVGAVPDDDAVAPLLDLLADRDRERLVLLGAHVLAEDAEELLRRQVRDVGELGDRAVELARREGGDDGAGPVVEPARDRAAGAEQSDVLLLRVEGEVLLRDLVDGLAVAELARRGDAVGPDADVVAVEELDDDVEVVGLLASRENDADERRAAVVDDLDLAPDADAEFFERRFRHAAVALEAVGALGDGDGGHGWVSGSSVRASEKDVIRA